LEKNEDETAMTVKTSVSISDQQDAFARRLVEEGRYSSVSAVVQQGLELLREQTERNEAELAALRALLDERRKGPFLTMEESHAQIQEMVANVKASYGL
jgi:antitoxin ParD1/3/4